MNLKRDNFTVDEIIELITGQVLVDGNGNESQALAGHNEAVRSVAEMFYDFKRPLNEMGAMAYDTDSKFVIHVGHIPEEMKIQACRSRPRPIHVEEDLDDLKL